MAKEYLTSMESHLKHAREKLWEWDGDTIVELVCGEVVLDFVKQLLGWLTNGYPQDGAYLLWMNLASRDFGWV